MPDQPQGAPGQNGDLPPAPPAGNQAPSGAAEITPGGANPPAVPFNNDPAIQDYIDRRVESRLREISQYGQPSPVQKPEESDPLQDVAKELAEQEKIDPAVAKSFVDKFVRIARHVTKEDRAKLTQFELTQRFAQVFAQNPNAEALAPRMRSIFTGLTELEKNFVLNSPDGALYLYDRAKREENRGALPPAARFNASNPPSRGSSPETKVGSKTSLFAKANQCLAKGDRAGYEEVMQQIQRG